MLIERTESFLKALSKIKDAGFKERIIKHIEKIISSPEIGKPMRYGRKGSREVHVPPYRLSYAFFETEQRLIFLSVNHKDEQ
jgi:mRNA-degrading endonuclease RelE of RelBE toxin-antitoxin system